MLICKYRFLESDIKDPMRRTVDSSIIQFILKIEYLTEFYTFFFKSINHASIINNRNMSVCKLKRDGNKSCSHDYITFLVRQLQM
nr:MAG TPA: hypothetical protein [Caudoviricetes sp.]